MVRRSPRLAPMLIPLLAGFASRGETAQRKLILRLVGFAGPVGLAGDG
jgi:hypothetical protein